MLGACVALSADGLVGCCACEGTVVPGIVSSEEQAIKDRQHTSAKMIANSFFIELPPLICGNSTISQAMWKKRPIGDGKKTIPDGAKVVHVASAGVFAHGIVRALTLLHTYLTHNLRAKKDG